MEEIDLTEYLETLIRRWRLLIGAAFVFTLVAVLVIFLMPEAYQTRVLIATDVGDLVTGLKPSQRLASLVELVSSPEIARAVLDDVGDQLPARERSSTALMKLVEGGLARSSDTVQILVTHRDPRVAMLVANAWGEEYVGHVDRTYKREAEDSQGRLHGAAQDARETYEKEQVEWEASLRQSRFDELSRRVAEYEAMIASLSNARKATVQGFLEQARRVDRLLVSARDMRAQVLAGGPSAVSSNRPALALLKAEALVAGEETSPAQPTMSAVRVHPMNQATKNRLAGARTGAQSDGERPAMRDVFSPPPVLITPQQQVHSSSSHLQIQAVPTDVTAEEMAEDLQALIVTLERRRDVLQAELAEALEATSQGKEWIFWDVARPEGTSGPGTSDRTDERLTEIINQLERRLRDTRVELAQEESRLQKAKARRDLAWETYGALAGEEAGATVTEGTRGTSVRLAASAPVPTQSTRHKARNAALAAVMGLVIGVIVVYVVEFWQNLRARPASVADTDQAGAVE